MKDGSWFVDVFTAEFSRDIAPMRGGFTDSYYYQMVRHIRRFKGLSPPAQRPAARDIQIDGQFGDWQGVPASYQDPPGDSMHRSFRGTDPSTTYTNNFGRNDILSARVAESKDQIHFQVSTAANLTPHSDAHWMILLIDGDQRKETGWNGYDLAINWAPSSTSQTSYATWRDSRWQPAGPLPFGYHGRQLEISIPNSHFPRQHGQSFDFKWVDNISFTSIESLFLEGDVAPDRRFNFRY
jgi:hypothetical protein